MKQQPLLTATDLCIGYRTHRVVSKVQEHLSFHLYAGELTSLLGANGVGKSTLIRTLAAFQHPLSGEVLLLDKPLQKYSEKECSRTIGVVLTDRTQAGGLTVYELVALGRQPHTGFFGRLHTKDHSLICEALKVVGIADKALCYTSELSDGERQKTMIAKTLVQECPLIILDEPTAFLDVVSRIEIMTLLHKLAVEQNKAILLSTHDIELALQLSDKLWLLSQDEGLQCGTTEDLILDQRMNRLFERGDVCFDYEHGGYSPIVKGHLKITVDASDERLLHWSINALNRNGYNCLLTSETNSFTLPHLYASTPHQLLLTYEGETQTYSSFEELLPGLSHLPLRSSMSDH